MFILHTANLYLDKPFLVCANRKLSNIRKEKQKEILQSIINKVFEYKADALLITGNLFDVECLSEQTFSFLCEQLESIQPVPVIIVPGNSDAIHDYSPYILETFPGNVVIMNLNKRVKWESDKIPLVVYTLTEDHSKGKNIKDLDIPSNSDGKNHILITYNLPTFENKNDLFLWFEKIPLTISYIAVGKGNRFQQLYNSSNLTACCCGYPEPISFNDKPPFGILGIQFQLLENQWKVSKIEHISIQKVFHAIIDIDLSTITEQEGVHTRLQSEFNKITKPSLIHVRFTGTISTSILKYIPEIIETMMEEHISLTWSIDGVIEGFENPEDERTVTVLSEFFKQALEEKKYAPTPSLGRVVTRAIHLTARATEKIPLKIPAVESCEVPLEWNS